MNTDSLYTTVKLTNEETSRVRKTQPGWIYYAKNHRGVVYWNNQTGEIMWCEGGSSNMCRLKAQSLKVGNTMIDLITLSRRATECERLAGTYDTTDPYKAGVYSGQAQILNEWADTLEDTALEDPAISVVLPLSCYGRWYDPLLALSPGYWISIRSRCAKWDANLRRLMSTHRFTEITKHCARLGPLRLWVANHPYGSFSEYPSGPLPSRVTAIHLNRKLKAETSMD